MDKIQSAIINVGCGNESFPNSYGCDVIKTKTTDIVCNAWEIGNYFTEARLIYSKNLLEHLTFDLAIRSLKSWFECLSVGGRLVVIVSNIQSYLLDWEKATWSGEAWRDRSSPLRQSCLAIWGDGANPRLSGYTAQSLRFFLQSAGFSDITCKETRSDIKAIAFKRMPSGERQIGIELKDIRKDHRGRYIFASKIINQGSSILDAACGIGYGAYILSKKDPQSSITGIDIDPYAIEYANTFYSSINIAFVQSDIFKFQSKKKFDAIVSFETIEHVDDIQSILSHFHSLLLDNGTFICSTPNQDTMPYSSSQFPFHVRHYTRAEIETLLIDAGFINIQVYSQHSTQELDVSDDDDGKFLLLVCNKI